MKKYMQPIMAIETLNLSTNILDASNPNVTVDKSNSVNANAIESKDRDEQKDDNWGGLW